VVALLLIRAEAPDSEEQLQNMRLSNAMKAVVARPNEAAPRRPQPQ
jgi:hypothetical protein